MGGPAVESDAAINHIADGRTQNKLTCFECDAPAATDWRRHTFRYGVGSAATDLTADIPVRRCKSCGFEFLDYEAETLMHEAVCTHLGVLSPRAIKDIRRRYRMSRAAFAEVTGLGEATLNRWENGIKVQTLANDRYLRLLALPENMQRLGSFCAAGQIPSPDPKPPNGKFRVLDLSKDEQRAQKRFHLRLAA